MLTAATNANAITRTPDRCTTATAPKLCSIHFHRDRTNRLRHRMGQRSIPYYWVAESHPARRDRILTYWTGVHRRTSARYQAWHRLQLVSPVALGRTLAAAHGWTGGEWLALYTLWNHESGWDANAVNESSGACSIPQFVPCRYLGDVRGSILAGIAYIDARYGSPSRALAHWTAYGWY